MPDEPEIDTDAVREQVDRALQRDDVLLKRVALTTALLAVCAAVASLRAGATANDALLLQTQATRLQAEASDQWAFYQAKGLKAAVDEASAAAWLATGKEPPPEYAERKEHYATEQRTIEERARRMEQQRDDKLHEAAPLLRAHHGFAAAVAIFQVAIALGAIAALGGSRGIWIGSLVLGGVGLVLLGVSFWR